MKTIKWDPESFIKNCTIQPKDNEFNTMFETYYNGIYHELIVKLDGYAIIPIEEYEKLLKLKEEK